MVVRDLLLLKCCFTPTETVGLLGTGAQDVHLDFHKLLSSVVREGPFCFTSTEARWLIRDGDRGGGGEGTKE